MFSSGECGFACSCLFLFCFCLVRGEKVASAQDFVGNQRERPTLGRGFLFLVYLVTILYCLGIFWSKDLSGCFFCFLPILDREFSFLFCFLPLFDWEFFFFFFFLFVFRGQGLTFSPWVKVYDKLGFWLKACRTAGHDICQGLASGSGIKGMSYIISMIHMQQ